jgi:hypothetical protein
MADYASRDPGSPPDRSGAPTLDPDVTRFAQRQSEPAPDSPNILAWQKRILGWGCAPAMAVGLLSGLAGAARPELAQTMAMVGTGLAILVAGPITLHTWRLRRDNKRRWEAAHARAADEGLEVRIVATEAGDHEYELVEAERIERIDWEARAQEQASPEAGSPSDPSSPPGRGGNNP